MESNFSSKVNGFEYYDVSFLPNHTTSNLGFGVPSSSDFDLGTNHLVPTTKDQDHPDENALLRYVNQLLMEESIMEKQSIFYDSLALQQTEEMLQQVIRDSQSKSCTLPCRVGPESKELFAAHFNDGISEPAILPNSISSEYWSSSNDSSVCIETTTNSNEIEVLYDPQGSNMLFGQKIMADSESKQPTELLATHFYNDVSGSALQRTNEILATSDVESVMQFKRGLEEASKFLPNTDQWIFNLEQESKGAKKNIRDREEEEEETRTSKQFAENVEDENKLTELFDKVLLLDGQSDLQIIEDGSSKSKAKKETVRERKKNQAIDFRTLLTLCAQSISSGDKITSDDLLKKIRERCTPLGDASQRLAYFFANALEARLEGSKGPMIQSYFDSMTLQKRTAAQTLAVYRAFLSSSPFLTLVYFFSNKMIYEASKDASVLHVIDFGILYGFQWPMFIQHISKTKTGPKKLRITGIELPQQGFRPTERIEDTGRRLTEYCKRFEVLFEYNAIASKNWETLKIEDFKIRPNEVLAVNSALRFKNLRDVTSDKEDCPRDRFLKLIRDMNPNVFLSSMINGSFNAPFFTTRFKEALFHYSALFDMFDSTLSRENPERIFFEADFYGREVMNVIACEGVDRVERPETYKQWQLRMMRAGFRQKVVEKELVERFREKMKKWGYHKDFVLDEDCNWFLQGWKGRILFSSSCWIPS